MRCARRTRGVFRLGLRSVLPVGPSTALAQLSRQFMKRERQPTPQTESNVERYFAPGEIHEIVFPTKHGTLRTPV